MVDEGRQGVAVDDVVGEEAPAGWRTKEGVGLRGFSRPRCMNGSADGMGVGNHGLGTRLSEMWGKLWKYPPPICARRFFRFRGITGISRVGISQEVGVFACVVILE